MAHFVGKVKKLPYETELVLATKTRKSNMQAEIK